MSITECRMENMCCKRIAIDNNVINWKAYQGLSPSIQQDPDKCREYQAILKLFNLQDKGQVTIVGVDQVDREVWRTANETRRKALSETWSLCKEKHCLTRFETLSKSKKASKSTRESGINLEDGAYWVTDDDMKKIEEYVAAGTTRKEKVDLEVLATVAIARVSIFVSLDCSLLDNKRLKDFVKQKDNIDIYPPSEIIKLLCSKGNM